MATTTVTAPSAQQRELVNKSHGFWWYVWARLRRDKPSMIALTVIIIFVLLAIFAPLLTPYSYNDGNLLAASQGPSRDHWLGTDELGRDVFTRLLYGARVSLAVAIAAQVVIIVIGLPIGLLTGYIGGLFDSIVMRIIDAFYALPNLLIAILIMSMLRSNISASAKSSGSWLASLDASTNGLVGIFIVMALTNWLTVSRLVRAQVLSLKEQDHVEAAQALGANDERIVRVHILPHVMAPVIIAIAFGVPGAIMLEASLSFLGIGVNPPTPSWGLMISSGITNMRSHPHLLIAPAMALGITLLAFTFLGDGLRDAMDPRESRG